MSLKDEMDKLVATEREKVNVLRKDYADVEEKRKDAILIVSRLIDELAASVNEVRISGIRTA